MAVDNHIPCSVEIQLTQGYTTTVNGEDADLCLLRWYPANKQGRIYVWRKSYGESFPAKTIHLHRVIMERVIGRALLPHEIVDHKDNNPLNNTRDNLRLADKSKNAQNAKIRSNNTSTYKGVWYHKQVNKWVAEIRHNGKKKHLGLFLTPEDAYEAYKKAAQERFGEFARLE